MNEDNKSNKISYVDVINNLKLMIMKLPMINLDIMNTRR